MNTLTQEKRILVLKCLVDGMSIRATMRVTGVSQKTITKLLVDAGRVSSIFQDRVLRNLHCRHIQVDEAWSFVYVKARRLGRAKKPPAVAGDVWIWVALCTDSKLVPTWRLGDRTAATGKAFIKDLKSRMAHRIQLTSDGHKPYLIAVEEVYGRDIDYAMLVKEYDRDERDKRVRYSGAHKEVIMGNPNPAAIGTSYIERQNLTMRMSIRRMTRHTNGNSKKVENHACAIALHYMYYNFCRTHMALREKYRERTPAMAAGLTDRPWEIADILNLMDAAVPKPKRPTRYATYRGKPRRKRHKKRTAISRGVVGQP
ncbi:MAG: IS1 family transposase [Chloroflexi bacterium]|nr:IS1 family transposase [Chloroflexota bacterium]